MGNVIAVHYRLPESGVAAAEFAAAGEPHVVDGEVVLRYASGAMVYVSWANEPVQHAAATQAHSFFLPQAPLTAHDVSTAPFWAPFLGQEVAFAYRDSQRQILELSSPLKRVLACAYENGRWQADALTICLQAPELGA